MILFQTQLAIVGFSHTLFVSKTAQTLTEQGWLVEMVRPRAVIGDRVVTVAEIRSRNSVPMREDIRPGRQRDSSACGTAAGFALPVALKHHGRPLNMMTNTP
jgi:hypothetical protein